MQENIKILFITEIDTIFSTGEYTQLQLFASNFADNIEHYIFMKKKEHFLFDFKNVILYSSTQEIRDFITSFKPNIIILSEIQHIPSFFLEYLYSTGITISTIDSIGFSSKFYKPDPKVIYLKNCPLNDPQANNKLNKYWFINNSIEFIRNDVLDEKFNLNKGSKKVLFSIARWQYNLSTHNLKNAMIYYEYVSQTIISILESLDENISLFFILPIDGFHNVIVEKGKLKIYFFNFLLPEDYKQVLYNSDLLISDNLSQMSMAQAFTNGSNVLSLINTKKSNFLNLHVFNMFPYNIPELELLYSYEYCKLVHKVEIFEINDIYNKIKLLLERPLNEHINYVDKCKELLSPNEIIKEIIEENR